MYAILSWEEEAGAANDVERRSKYAKTTKAWRLMMRSNSGNSYGGTGSAKGDGRHKRSSQAVALIYLQAPPKGIN